MEDQAMKIIQEQLAVHGEAKEREFRHAVNAKIQTITGLQGQIGKLKEQLKKEQEELRALAHTPFDPKSIWETV